VGDCANNSIIGAVPRNVPGPLIFLLPFFVACILCTIVGDCVYNWIIDAVVCVLNEVRASGARC
jgi:hypothetical protein